MTVAERLERLSEPEPNSGCHLWLGNRDEDGYGKFTHEGRSALAHRVAYEEAGGVVPPGHELDHKCVNPPCINVVHLRPVTHRTNLLLSRSFIAEQVRRTACIHGHAFDEGNTYRRPGQARRDCRICRAASKRRALQLKRESTA